MAIVSEVAWWRGTDRLPRDSASEASSQSDRVTSQSAKGGRLVYLAEAAAVIGLQEERAHARGAFACLIYFLVVCWFVCLSSVIAWLRISFASEGNKQTNKRQSINQSINQTARTSLSVLITTSIIKTLENEATEADILANWERDCLGHRSAAVIDCEVPQRAKNQWTATTDAGLLVTCEPALLPVNR